MPHAARSSSRGGTFLTLLAVHGCAQQPTAEHPRCKPCPECPAPSPSPVATAAQTPPASEPVEPVEEEPAWARVAAGQCNVSWLPPGLATDVSDEAAARLVEVVRNWVESRRDATRGGNSYPHRRHRPAIDLGRGIVWAKSDDDYGGDPPNPTFIGRDSTLGCGRNALWLAQHARALVAAHAIPDDDRDGVRCSENVCCFDALGEGGSSGTLVFRPDEDGRWVLQAIAIVADNASLGENWVREQRAWVVRQLTARGAERCRGEPPGHLW